MGDISWARFQCLCREKQHPLTPTFIFLKEILGSAPVSHISSNSNLIPLNMHSTLRVERQQMYLFLASIWLLKLRFRKFQINSPIPLATISAASCLLSPNQSATLNPPTHMHTLLTGLSVHATPVTMVTNLNYLEVISPGGRGGG